jgi:hypothetical protein
MTLRGSLFSREVVPFYLSLLALLVATLAVDAALHLLDLVWVGKWLGIPGVLLICASFGYSLRKRKLIARGHPATLLHLHERMAWAGSLLVLVHAGIHFNAILAWLAVAFTPLAKRDGAVFALTLTLHPISRFLLEMIRIDEAPALGTPFSISQVVSIILLALAAGLWWWISRQPPRRPWDGTPDGPGPTAAGGNAGRAFDGRHPRMQTPPNRR